MAYNNDYPDGRRVDRSVNIEKSNTGIDQPDHSGETGSHRSLLPQRIADSLRDMIVENVLPPGSRIRERAMTERLNVSRTPLREALKVLAGEGLIELLPNRGAVVSDPTLVEVSEMLQVQAHLEEMAAYQFCERASEAEIESILAMHYEMLAYFHRRERLPYFKLNQRIHRAIVEGAHNKTLASFHGMLSARLYRFRYQPNLRHEHWQSAVDEHEEIVAAIRGRDADRLSHALKDHLQSTSAKLSALESDDDLEVREDAQTGRQMAKS